MQSSLLILCHSPSFHRYYDLRELKMKPNNIFPRTKVLEKFLWNTLLNEHISKHVTPCATSISQNIECHIIQRDFDNKANTWVLTIFNYTQS